MDEATQRQLQARADKGLPVSFIDDVPEIPNDVADIYRTFAELRAMTPADAPVSYPDLRLAWEVGVADGVFDDENGDASGIDFPVFARMIAAMDNVFGKRQMERMKKEINKNKSNQESARKAAEEKARRRSGEVNAKIGPSKGASRTKH